MLVKPGIRESVGSAAAPLPDVETFECELALPGLYLQASSARPGLYLQASSDPGTPPSRTGPGPGPGSGWSPPAGPEKQRVGS